MFQVVNENAHNRPQQRRRCLEGARLPFRLERAEITPKDGLCGSILGLNRSNNEAELVLHRGKKAEGARKDLQTYREFPRGLCIQFCQPTPGIHFFGIISAW